MEQAEKPNRFLIISYRFRFALFFSLFPVDYSTYIGFFVTFAVAVTVAIVFTVFVAIFIAFASTVVVVVVVECNLLYFDFAV